MIALCLKILQASFAKVVALMKTVKDKNGI